MSEVVPISPLRGEVASILAHFPVGDTVRFEDGSAVVTSYRISPDLRTLDIELLMKTGPYEGAPRTIPIPLGAA